MTSFFGTCLGKLLPDLLLLLVLELITEGADGRWMSGGNK